MLSFRRSPEQCCYWALHRQRRSARPHELDLLPFKEPFERAMLMRLLAVAFAAVAHAATTNLPPR
jgi:hypothetical protein